MEPIYIKFVKNRHELKGSLKFIIDNVVKLEVVARSGQYGYGESYWNVGLSPIPPSNAIVGKYFVNFNGYTPGNQNACGDIFYPIIPDPIHQKNGTGMRSEIGLHEDANYDYAPGSAGCIAVSPKHWVSVKTLINKLKAKNINKLPLYVVYI